MLPLIENQTNAIGNVIIKKNAIIPKITVFHVFIIFPPNVKVNYI